MRTRAKISIVFAVFIVIYTILPFFFGIYAQRNLQQFLTQENNTVGKVMGIQLTVRRYERSWFHSRVIIDVDQKAENGAITFVKRIRLTITHGPFFMENNKPRLGLFAMTADPISFDSLPKYYLTLTGDFDFSGAQAVLTMMSGKNVDIPSIADAKQLVLNIKSNLDADHFDLHLQGEGLRYQSPDHFVSVLLGTIDSRLEVRYLSDQHWQLRWGFDLDHDQLSLGDPNTTAPFVFGADKIDVKGLHFDTQKLATILSEIVQIKSADDNGAVVSPAVWIGVVQQFLTQLVNSDTWVSLRDLSFTTPSGQVLLHYNASFPALPDVHDYFDVATKDVSQLALSVPDWSYVDQPSNMQFGLTNFKLTASNNTIFSRQMAVEIGAFDMKDLLSNTPGQPVVYATGFSYMGHNYGDTSSVSQIAQWRLNQVCFSGECFSALKGELDLLNMNFSAFRNIAMATQSLMNFNQAQPDEMKWSNLESAYIALVQPNTRFILTHQMKTPAGDMHLYAALSWPHYAMPPSVAPDMDLFIGNTNYQVRAQLPVSYVTVFLQDQKAAQAAMKKTLGPKVSQTVPPTIAMQAASIIDYAIAKGYLKRVGDDYIVDLVGTGTNATLNGIPWQNDSQGS